MANASCWLLLHPFGFGNTPVAPKRASSSNEQEIVLLSNSIMMDFNPHTRWLAGRPASKKAEQKSDKHTEGIQSTPWPPPFSASAYPAAHRRRQQRHSLAGRVCQPSQAGQRAGGQTDRWTTLKSWSRITSAGESACQTALAGLVSAVKRQS